MQILQTFHLLVALNISYSLLSAAELRDGITKTTEYLQYERCFGFRRAANAKESRLCAYPYPTQDRVRTAFHSASNMCLSKEITLSHTAYSPQHSQLDGIQNTLHTVSIRLFLQFIYILCKNYASLNTTTRPLNQLIAIIVLDS